MDTYTKEERKLFLESLESSLLLHPQLAYLWCIYSGNDCVHIKWKMNEWYVFYDMEYG